LRSSRSDNGSLVSAPAPENAATQVVLAFDDNRLASLLFGQYGQNLALIERRLGVVAEQRGNHVALAGSRDSVERSRRVPVVVDSATMRAISRVRSPALSSV